MIYKCGGNRNLFNSCCIAQKFEISSLFRYHFLKQIIFISIRWNFVDLRCNNAFDNTLTDLLRKNGKVSRAKNQLPKLIFSQTVTSFLRILRNFNSINVQLGDTQIYGRRFFVMLLNQKNAKQIVKILLEFGWSNGISYRKNEAGSKFIDSVCFFW